jgi:hypothetical protein
MPSSKREISPFSSIIDILNRMDSSKYENQLNI